MKSNLISTIGIIIFSFIGSAHAVSTQLTLVKEVIGGEATVTDWVLTADGTDANDLSGAGWVSGFVTPDTFNLSESAGPAGYTAGDWDCAGGGILDGQSLTLSAGDVVTCTIINTFVPAIVIFDTDFALPSMPVGDGTGTPVCIDDVSGLLVAGCDVSDQIDPTLVQKRVDGVCATGYSIRVINSDGSVVCEPDVDTVLSEAQVDSYVSDNGYGDITAVTTAAGSGLTGGLSSGSVALSVSGVTSAMITNGTITGSDISTSTTISAADFTYSSVRTGYAFISPLSCKQYNNATGTVDANVYFTAPPTNAHGPFLQLRNAEGAGDYYALCRTDIQVPPTSTVYITGATLMFADESAACLVGGWLRGKHFPSAATTDIASVYSGTSSSDLATMVGYNQTKAFPAFSAYPVTQSATSATDVFFELEIEQNESTSYYCRFIGVQLAYTVNKP